MVYTLGMTKDDIIAEMHRKPDAEILLEWLYEQVSDELKDAFDAYWEGIEEHG